MVPSSKAITEAGIATPSLKIWVIPAFVPISPMDGKPDLAVVSGCLTGSLERGGVERLLQIHLWPERKGLPCKTDPDIFQP